MRAIGTVLLCCALASAAPALAGPLERGAESYELGDYAAALRLWRPLAEAGDAAAQHNLGVMHAEGRGVPQDVVKAVTWYRKAAEQNLGEAQYNLGNMYVIGEGVPQSYVEAYKWYILATANLHAGARRNLAMRNHDWVVTLMTPAQIVQSRKLAQTWTAQ